MKTLIIVGSTREGRKSIDAAQLIDQKLVEKEHESELFDLKEKEIPFLGKRSYTGERPVPEDVQALSREVEESDCIIIVSPEYNHSIPGVLKNALDYLYPEYNDKPFSYVTTSAGGFGGIRALDHLQDITLALGGFPGPALQTSKLGDKFEDGGLVDESYGEKVSEFIDEIEDFVNKFDN